MKKSRRKFTAGFKAKVAIEAIKEIKTVSELAQIYQVHPNLITHWKKEFLSNAGKVFNAAKDESDKIYLPIAFMIYVNHFLHNSIQFLYPKVRPF